MGVQVGLVGQRADLAVEVAALAARAGAVVVALTPEELSFAVGGLLPGVHLDLVLVDVAAPAPGTGRPVSAAGAPEPIHGLGEDPEPRSPEAAVGHPQAPTIPPPVPLVVLCRSGEGTWARQAAVGLGSSHVVELPIGSPWLVAQLAPRIRSGVLGVVGGVGGVGATTVAIACAVGAGDDCLLVDGDPDSSGLDLPLGIPEGAGARWSEIPDTSEPLDPGLVRSALPQVGQVAVVTGSGVGVGVGVASGVGPGRVPGAGRMAGILGVGRAEFARTVVDAGRGRVPAGLLGPGDAVALVLPATLAGVVAGRRVLAGLESRRVVVLLRPTVWLPAADVAEQLGVANVLEVPRLRRAAELADCGDLLSGRTGRALRSLGERVWEHAS